MPEADIYQLIQGLQQQIIDITRTLTELGGRITPADPATGGWLMGEASGHMGTAAVHQGTIAGAAADSAAHDAIADAGDY
jgi:hypothetical protein